MVCRDGKFCREREGKRDKRKDKEIRPETIASPRDGKISVAREREKDNGRRRGERIEKRVRETDYLSSHFFLFLFFYILISLKSHF